MTSTFPRRLARKIRQTRRLSRKSIAFLFLLAGSALVALTALFFAHLADFALELNAKLVQQYPWFAWIALPPGLPVIVWLTRKFAPFTAGSGIPQVIASLSLPYGAQKTRLIRLGQTLLKIPLTFLGMLFGASIGREGPSVQVGAAVMGAWGAWCKKHGLAFKGMQENDLMAAGAAGGLAAAFNAPLAGVIFAIEELGRGIMLRWERQILLGVLAAGFIQVAIQGNNPYFSGFNGGVLENILMWIVAAGLVCGAAGGIFARMLHRGAAAFAPRKIRGFIRNRPLLLAALMGLLLALLGTFYQGKTYGTGYHEAAQALHGIYEAPVGLAAAKWLATVFSYWAGIPGGIFTPSLTIGAVLGEHIAGCKHHRPHLHGGIFSGRDTIADYFRRRRHGNDRRAKPAVLDADCLHFRLAGFAPVFAASVLPRIGNALPPARASGNRRPNRQCARKTASRKQQNGNAV